MSAPGPPACGPPVPAPGPQPPRLLLYVAEEPRRPAPPPLRRMPDPQLYSMHKTYYKSTSSNFEDNLLNGDHQRKCDSVKQSVLEYPNIETFQSRIPGDANEIYQTRFPSIGVDNQVQQVPPLIVKQNCLSENGVINYSDKESHNNKSYMNYHFLEQNITHQSVVNQSISVVNHQVSGACVGESEGQLVRTGEGVVLAVVPALSHDPSDLTLTITVPLGWKRIISGVTVVYISPSGTALGSLPQVREYLQTSGTCKCGLPCPLRPEATFSFDPKVVSRPYQPPTGSELARLCNHKRKLLATLSARAQSPATPPLNTETNKVGEVAILKKKMKKPVYSAPSSVVQQHAMHRDQRPQGDFNKVQEMDQRTNPSPGLRGRNQGTAGPAPPGSHYLTVNSGWIQHDAPPPTPAGVPVLAANGQVIGVNTAYCRGNLEEQKTDLKEPQTKEEEGQIFCGLNQPLTPEVMQKINEQQQLFIQQNQKQIEMAMKGYRVQLESSSQNSVGPNFVSQSQFVVQNGAVVKTNSAKTPPWQVKRTEPMTSPSPKSQKSDNMDFDDSSTNHSEESVTSNGSFQSSESSNQSMCSRVPPLPQHYSVIGQQWTTVEQPKKKPKNTNKSPKKKGSPDNKIYGTNGMRAVQASKERVFDNLSANNVPSFMDDPSGYLAQQTEILNHTISRQVGLHPGPSAAPGGSNDTHRAKSDYQMVFKGNTTPNALPSPSSTPDSSVVGDRGPECCQVCHVGRAADVPAKRTYGRQASGGARADGDSPRASSTTSDIAHEPPHALHEPPHALHEPPHALHEPPHALHEPPHVLHQQPCAPHEPLRAPPPPYLCALGGARGGGWAMTRDTVTSVQAGRALTATTSVNAARPPPAAPAPPAHPAPLPDPFLHAVNLPTSYPLHIVAPPAPAPAPSRRPSAGINPGQILISSTGQIMVPSAMAPPPPKTGPFLLQEPVPAPARDAHDAKGASCVQSITVVSPESKKKKTKKKKSHTSITNVLQIAAPPSNIVLHSSPQHNTSPQFSPRGFQMSPNSLSPGPMLQALTIVPGKPGTPAHIVMNNQGAPGNFTSQSLIANTSPTQQINLLQPVNLINNPSGVVANFTPIQQFLLPSLGNVVMTADGSIIQENSPVQLQIQTVNGQNVFTPVQNAGVFNANGGVVLRTQNQQGKIIQSQHSPGAQFLSPGGQVMMGSPNFNGQLSPLLAGLSPTQVTFNTSPHQVRGASVPGQEFIQANQLGQLMVPLSPKQAGMGGRSSSTFVQRNTTIVQQQTTLMAESGGGGVLLEGGEARHVSTQAGRGGASPPAAPPRPDTTTRDLDPEPERTPPPLPPPPPPPPPSAMVQCVSSSEPDASEARSWPPAPPFAMQHASQTTARGQISNLQMMRQIRHNPVESTDIHYNHSITQMHQQEYHHDVRQSNYYERPMAYKRKSDYDPNYRSEKVMRTYDMHGNEKTYDYGDGKKRLYSGNSSESNIHVFGRRMSDHDTNPEYQASSVDEEHPEPSTSDKPRSFEVGDLVWGPVKGYASWPGKLVRQHEGKWHVKWFGGDKAPGVVDHSKLLTLTEGLEAHHNARTKHRKSRKLNTLLENAIQQAMAELDKMTESSESPDKTEPLEDTTSTLPETPKRRKHKEKRPLVKLRQGSPDNTRLRSAR